MYSDSRKAQRNSFAHHRAQLLFSRREAQASDTLEWAATVLDGTEPAAAVPSRLAQVRTGLRGFVPAGAASPC